MKKDEPVEGKYYPDIDWTNVTAYINVVEKGSWWLTRGVIYKDGTVAKLYDRPANYKYKY